jgi:hypothetical protein
MKVSFLLGAGASIPAGMPSTADITRTVLSGSGFHRHPDNRYRPGDATWSGYIRVPDLTTLLSLLQACCVCYFSEFIRGRETNYEDLYYLAEQLYDHLCLEFENPALDGFARNLRLKCAELGILRHEYRFEELLAECVRYIEDVVIALLSKQPSSLTHLPALVAACQRTDISRVDVFTLNHDCVLESILQQAAPDYESGFVVRRHDVDYWDPSAFRSTQKKCRLFKLHGSINWYSYEPDPDNPRRLLVGIPRNQDPDHTHDWSGKLQWPQNVGRPLLLVGTFNKVYGYSRHVFADIFAMFREFIFDSPLCIISGYGGGDKGVNQILTEWINRCSHNRLVLIHPNPDDLFRSCRGALQKLWKDPGGSERFKVIRKPIEDADWGQIQALSSDPIRRENCLRQPH